jgi:molybdenum cofactor synthesis domain-containing protein
MKPMRVAILTVSDKGSRGERADTSGDAIAEFVVGNGGEVCARTVVADERAEIAAAIKAWCDGDGIDLVLTTGGTGLAPRDVTPEAVMDVAERTVPGIAEAMRAEGLRHTPMSMLSRSIAVTRGKTLIITLPGSEKGVRESLAAIITVLLHAVDLLQGRTEHS